MEAFITQLFLHIFNMSIAASYLVLVVVVARFLLRKAPRGYLCILWLFVAIRLICPFAVESVFSLLPSEPIIENEILVSPEPEIHISTSAVNKTLEKHQVQYSSTEPQNSMNKWQSVVMIVSYLWIVGMIAMFTYFMTSWHRIQRKVREAVPKEEGGMKYYICDRLDSPFLFGMLPPKIYIPEGLKKEDLVYVLQHENAHKRRKDYLIKPFGFFVLAIHWFNPVVWIAYILMCRDIELACDERVIKELGEDYKKEYSKALLSCAANRKATDACPVAFGEIGIKQRVKNILQYKKPAVWISIATLLACIVIFVCFMTQKKQEIPVVDEKSTSMENIVEQWAKAFVNRDADTIYEMASSKVRTEMEKKGLLQIAENYKAFGGTSPWPWGDAANYKIISAADDTAEILYYAQTSDPHVWVWYEKVDFAYENDKYVIISEELQDNLYPCVAEEFYILYPNGEVSGTPMDYLATGAGEYLNTNARNNKESKFYKELFAPDTAAVYLLNLLNNRNKVGVEVTYPDERNGDMKYPTAYVTFRFYEDDSSASVSMIQPYGEDGIWIPQTYGAEENYVYEQADGELSLYDIFPEPHEMADIPESKKIDLNGDGTMETITYTNLDYQGGDGGYTFCVTRTDETGKEVEIPISDYTPESGFPFYTSWDGEKLYVYYGENTLLYTYTKEELQKRYKADIEEGGEPFDIEINSKSYGDAVSGYTYIQGEHGQVTIYLKSYISGLMGHADCLGYGITCLRLGKDYNWEVSQSFYPE